MVGKSGAPLLLLRGWRRCGGGGIGLHGRLDVLLVNHGRRASRDGLLHRLHRVFADTTPGDSLFSWWGLTRFSAQQKRQQTYQQRQLCCVLCIPSLAPLQDDRRDRTRTLSTSPQKSSSRSLRSECGDFYPFPSGSSFTRRRTREKRRKVLTAERT